MNERVDDTKTKITTTDENTPMDVINTENTTADRSISQAETLWNQFLRNISKRQDTTTVRPRYPNPDVPEFYPRSVANVVAATQKVEPESASANIRRVFHKNDILVRRMSQQCLATNVASFKSLSPHAEPNIKLISRMAENADLFPGVTRYYWKLPEHIPKYINFDVDANGLVRSDNPLVISFNETKSSPTVEELQLELNTKNQQIAHLNNVVKALLEEIWKINELSTRGANTQLWKNDLSFAINEFLKPNTELGFHCDDCCDRLKEFVARISKQLERKMTKQHALYKNSFVDGVLSVVENSLRALTGSFADDISSKLLKHDVYTQTDDVVGHWPAGRPSLSRADARRGKFQNTKIYRNRNFYRTGGMQQNGEAGCWYPAPAPSSSNQCTHVRDRMARHHQGAYPPLKFPHYPQTQLYSEGPQTINPIQLIHQKYKNLNCRLEGIPDKSLVKFSYIVDGKEYSAVASTKKEAQYHCAWHVLGATNHG